MGKRIDLTGKTFGRITVVGASDVKTAGQLKWHCKCDCGTKKLIAGVALRTGLVVSCGCYRNEIASGRNRTHGEGTKRTPEYRCWANMIQRCSGNADSQDRVNYFERGIVVCEKWRSYDAFLADMGRRPSSDHSIDRIDNDGNYEPGNCRWALLETQSVNKRTNCNVEYHGQTMAFKRAWESSSRVVGYGTAHSRWYRDGWPPEAAIDTPRIALAGRRDPGSTHWTTSA